MHPGGTGVFIPILLNQTADSVHIHIFFKHWELLYADDLVLLADSEEDLKRKLQRWKSGLEAKGLRVNVGKTKVMKCGVGLQKVVDSRKYPCGVCGKGVDANSIKCTLCMKWVHKRCSDISRKLRAEDAEAFKCKTCVKGAQSLNKLEAGLC